MKSPKNPPKDILLNLKAIAYSISQGVRDNEHTQNEKGRDYFQEFLNTARWFIAREKKILFYDPILEKYTPEQIMVEYYGLLLDKSKDFRAEMEYILDGGKAKKDSNVKLIDKLMEKEEQEESKGFNETPADWVKGDK